MYIICTYDVKSKNCPRFMKLLRRYLFHIQESVFAGELTPNQYKKLQRELNTLITEEDHVMLFYTYNTKMVYKKELGKQLNKESFIIE